MWISTQQSLKIVRKSPDNPIRRHGKLLELSSRFSEYSKSFLGLPRGCLDAYHTKSQSIVDKRKKYEIFESYANGGFPILLEKLDVDETTVLDQKTKERVLKRYYSLLIRNNGFKG